MPPKLALVLTLGFIVFLYRRDIREKPNVTGALWIPILWMFLIASRPVSVWLHIFGLPGFTASSAEEGSPLDAFVFLGLIVLGAGVLSKRQVNLLEVIQKNAWLTVFVFYCFLAVFWSDFPFVSLKRWIKILGHPIMALVIFTEPDPREAFVRLMKRCVYVFLPVSILWMKYYIALGRKTSQFGGVTNCGIAVGGNVLAAICSIWGLFFLWHLLQVLRRPKSLSRRDELRLTVGLLLMIGYCLVQADSATSDICLLIGAATMMLLGLRFVNKRAIGAYALTAVIVFVLAQLTFNIYGVIIGLTGREATIQSRGFLWQTLLKIDTNSMFGTGFESFWLGDRVERIWSMPEFWWHPNQAHNGYLELYLNLGILGLVIFIGAVVATFRKIQLGLLRNLEWGRFQMAVLIAILLHNWTEAGFKGLSFPFLMFFIIAVDYPQRCADLVAEPFEPSSPEEEAKLSYSQGKA